MGWIPASGRRMSGGAEANTQGHQEDTVSALGMAPYFPFAEWFPRSRRSRRSEVGKPGRRSVWSRSPGRGRRVRAVGRFAGQFKATALGVFGI